MQPRDAGESSGGGLSREEKVRSIIEDILDKLPEIFNIQELMSKTEDRTPFIIVAFQECERMNILCSELRRSLRELELGLKVGLENFLLSINKSLIKNSVKKKKKLTIVFKKKNKKKIG